MLKQVIKQYSVAFALGIGIIFFLLTFMMLTRIANWMFWLSVGVAAIAFLVVTFAGYIFANNIVDTYTFEVARNEPGIYRNLRIIQSKIGNIKDRAVVQTLSDICKNTPALLDRTKKNQPNDMLSAVTMINQWLETLTGTLDQYIDVQDNPNFHESPGVRLEKAKNAFIGVNAMFLNSIRLLEKGENVKFDVALKMMDASRYQIV
jgi:hypothetical protein